MKGYPAKPRALRKNSQWRIRLLPSPPHTSTLKYPNAANSSWLAVLVKHSPPCKSQKKKLTAKVLCYFLFHPLRIYNQNSSNSNNKRKAVFLFRIRRMEMRVWGICSHKIYLICIRISKIAELAFVVFKADFHSLLRSRYSQNFSNTSA